MVMQVEISQDDLNTIKYLANGKNIDEFSPEFLRKAVHNAIYEAKIKQGLNDLKEGRTITYSKEEWEKLGREYNFH